MKNLCPILIFLILVLFAYKELDDLIAPVVTFVNAENIHSFEFNGKKYELITEKKSWFDAGDCAVDRGASVAEINTDEEQANI